MKRPKSLYEERLDRAESVISNAPGRRPIRETRAQLRTLLTQGEKSISDERAVGVLAALLWTLGYGEEEAFEIADNLIDN